MADKVHPFQTDLPTHAPPSRHASRKNAPQKPLLPPLAAYRRLGRSSVCNPFCCFGCCGRWLCSFLCSFLIFIGILVLIVYLIFRPKVPKFSVTDAHVSVFNLTSRPLGQIASDAAASAYLQADVNFTIEAKNPNKRIGYYADQIDATLNHDGLQIGNGSLPPFYLGHKDVKQLQLQTKGVDTPLTDSSDSGLQAVITNGSSIGFEVMAVTEGRIKVWVWKSRRFKVRVKCDVQMSSVVAGRNSQVESDSCKWKVVRFWL